MGELSVINEETLYYENELLELAVLGGIKLEGLDRMRATLKISLKESSVPPIRHSLDLYNDTQVEKLSRKTATRLEIGLSVIEASIAELTENLEEYRLKHSQENQAQQYESLPLTDEEKKEAEKLLKAPKLLDRTNQLIGKSGVVGEEINRLIMYLIFTSRKREQPLHIVSLGSSGTGKTHLQEKIGELIPEEDRVEITSLSENAFYYFGQRELKHKLILIEDLDGVDGALYPLRELQSKKRISKTIAQKNSQGETKPLHLVVEGPVSVAGCTTKERIYEDNANRSFLIYLDESEDQDNRIMDYQRRASAGKLSRNDEKEAVRLLRNCQKILQPVHVINPYAEYLHIPKEVFKPRRTNNHYLQFVEAITFYYQHQREQKVNTSTGEIYIETTEEDIRQANYLLKDILLRKSDELSGACRSYFERLKKWLKDKGKAFFTNREARAVLRISISKQKRYMCELQSQGLVSKYDSKDANQKSGFHYKVTDHKEYEGLQKRIETALDKALEKAIKAV